MLLRVIIAIIVFFAVYYLLKNNGYITVNRNFDLDKFLKKNISIPTLYNNAKNPLPNENSKVQIKKKKMNNAENINPVIEKKNEGVIEKEIEKEIENIKNNVYLDIQINDTVDRIEIELFDKIVPKTSNNFRSLCEQKMYTNCEFHKIIKNLMIMGGDFTQNNGKGGRSIYGEKFDDENFTIKHDKIGILSMLNSGPNTNNSQFCILLKPAQELDNKNVAFGQVTKGLNVLNKLHLLPTDYTNKPASKCFIKDCGILQSNSEKCEQEITSNI